MEIIRFLFKLYQENSLTLSVSANCTLKPLSISNSKAFDTDARDLRSPFVFLTNFVFFRCTFLAKLLDATVSASESEPGSFVKTASEDSESLAVKSRLGNGVFRLLLISA